MFVALAAALAPAEEGVGKRFFSDQLVLSEPFVEDEVSLPTILHIRRATIAGQPGAVATQIGAELKKRLTRNLEASLAGGLTHLNRDENGSVTGFDNLELGLKYQFLRDAAHEAVAAVRVAWEVGGTGRSATGAESFDTVILALLFGKGFGDLPDALGAFKPLAVSGLLGANIPTGASSRTVGDRVVSEAHPDVVEWGVLFAYSVPYLQSFVKDIRLPRPLGQLVPLAEFDFQTALDRGARGRTTGTANAGAVWVGKSVQVGLEAVVPINERSGTNVGLRAFVRFDLDRVLGGRAARPVFGGVD